MPTVAIAVIGFSRHGVLLVFGAPSQLDLLAGQEHGRTIPLATVGAMQRSGRYRRKSGHRKSVVPPVSGQ